MTLLMVETRRTDETFGELWLAWRREHGLPAPSAHHGAEALFDHFPFLLWEHFPAVTLGAARRIALAARAHGMASGLRDARVRGGGEASTTGAARAWLRDLARRRLEPIIPPGDRYWRLLADDRGPRGLPSWSDLPHATAAAFAVCGGDPALLPAVQESQTHLYAGLALYRDCVRWKRDFLAGYRSEVVGPLLDALGGTSAPDTLGTSEPDTPGTSAPDTLGASVLDAFGSASGAAEREARLPDAARVLHYGGVAERALDAAAEHLARSMAAVTDLPPVSFAAMLARLYGDVLRLRSDLAETRARHLGPARARAAVRSRPPAAARLDDMSDMSDMSEHPVRVSVAHMSENPVRVAATHTSENAVRASDAQMSEKAVRAALAHMGGEQYADGHFGDFLVLTQQSTSWATGYVGWNLAHAGLRAPALDAAARWLVENRAPGGGWGYNGHWPADNDSTANALMFLIDRPGVDRALLEPALDHLLATQAPDGGFTTVDDLSAWLVRFRAPTDDAPGWTTPHPCVTAMVALMLSRVGGDRATAAADAALTFLRRCQRPAGYWDAYWWVGGLYTTCRAVQALCAVKRESPDAGGTLARAAGWLLRSRRADGGWSGGHREGSGAFQTALAVQALCALRDDHHDHHDREALERAVAGGVRWLAGHQLPDGSWPVEPVLRVPRPDVVEPWRDVTWTESILGLDIVVPDWRRLFTGAAAVHALRRATGPLSRPTLEHALKGER
ncbi:prenyltransferase/squalene oxidase repeat-containing protein [Sphaerisporangium dianthi]|uniref:Prenyltransferase/squalene oxidase repeat-containing protein n=1 Tax=Sphaerisporangium dianthi TaxID=1436120 RepID=A0ABV9CGE5_9ACTN